MWLVALSKKGAKPLQPGEQEVLDLIASNLQQQLPDGVDVQLVSVNDTLSLKLAIPDHETFFSGLDRLGKATLADLTSCGVVTTEAEIRRIEEFGLLALDDLHISAEWVP